MGASLSMIAIPLLLTTNNEKQTTLLDNKIKSVERNSYKEEAGRLHLVAQYLKNKNHHIYSLSFYTQRPRDYSYNIPIIFMWNLERHDVNEKNSMERVGLTTKIRGATSGLLYDRDEFHLWGFYVWGGVYQ